MEQKDLNQKQQEAFEHLHKGRARMALPIAEELIQHRPESSEAAICYAWACLENGDTPKAMYYTELSSKLQNDSILTRMYRGYLQMRLSNFEASIYDFNMTEGKQKELLAWTYLNKSKSLASIGESDKAGKFFELSLMIDNNANPEWKSLRKYFSTLSEFKNDLANLDENKFNKYCNSAEAAFKEKEYWFSLLIAKELAKKEEFVLKNNSVLFLELESMLKLNQYVAVENKIEKMQDAFKDNEKIAVIKDLINKYHQKKEAKISVEPKLEVTSSSDNLKLHPNSFAEITSLSLYDHNKEKDAKQKSNLVQINYDAVPIISLQAILKNLFYQKETKKHSCFVAWYLDEDIVDQSTFELEVPADWDAVMINEHSYLQKNKFWQKGNASVSMFLNRERIFDYHFIVGESNVIKENTLGLSEDKKKESKESKPVSIADALAELDKITGLKNVKNTVKELIDYLEFMRERKQLGLKSKDQVSVHATFLGNPGTGKTTVARLMGKIFKGMGLLEKGEVIEVDRSSLVGQYVGETAQKTEKIIESAIGNVLFIDEAYTLVKKGATSDFGQEAIDVLLKRMEDRKGEFFVIAAGYPKEMDDFLGSNPGLKSRFTHHFIFEDYVPEELMEIFKGMVKDEEYRVMNSAEVFLLKELVNLYRKRDKNFGNARTVRKIYDDIKIQLSKRYLSLPKHERSKEKLMTITEEDIKEVLQTKDDTKHFDAPINDELLNEALQELNKLTGLSLVKNDVHELIKLARYYKSSGEDLRNKFSSHILFFGNPGTGKTTVARIISKIYSALAILPSGQLIEADRQGLVASYVGQTAEKTKSIIDSAIGGTLFIDEAYTLVKKDSGGDFGQEAIDTLLKRMEDDRGKFICIAAGYTEEMKSFLESNPGMKSRFTKTFFFEDYNPDELMTIFEAISKKNNLKLNEESKILLFKHFNDIYRSRDKNFGNARIVRNLFDSVNKKHMMRLINMDKSELTAEAKSVLTQEDFEEIGPKEKVTSFKIKGDDQKLNEYLDELKRLTGLDEVKDGVQNLVNGLKIANLRKEKGLDVIQKPLHSVFTGNPGTGKTTVARLLSSIFKELGILEKGHLVEVDRAQLVAGYTGQTAIKTDQVITSALGGTLFIDEAYTLSRGSNDFGQEAIDTLLKRMEDFKGKFIVIAAGYTNEMKTFLEANPGLTSRFNNKFHFADYNPQQLFTIADAMAKSSKYQFDEGAKAMLIKKFETLYLNRDKNFGNARTARNILLDIISKQETRLAQILNPTLEELTQLTSADVNN